LITLSEYRHLTAKNHGAAIGVLKNLDENTINAMGIQWFIDQAKEINEEWQRIKSLEIDYTK